VTDLASGPTLPRVNRGRAFRERRRITVGNNYLWKTDGQLNRVAEVRYAHGDELTGLPGVTGIGIGKDHIIVYVSNDAVAVPAQIEEVPIIKIRRI
jgi:hypothetical protein